MSTDRQEPAAKAGTVGELVGAYISAQCDVLASNDIGLRTGAPVVHQTRVAARRLRSTLRVFGDVVDAAAADELNNELAWYAKLLGQVRDREVLNTRLTNLIADLPPEHVRGPVEAEITKTLAKERDDAIQRLNAAMRTRRYQHLVQLLGGWKTAPPFSAAAGRQDKIAVKYVEQAKEKADNRLRKADDDVELLHRARRAEKRLRYAAELAEPADKRMKTHRTEGQEAANPVGRASRCQCRSKLPRDDQRSIRRGERREWVHLRRSRGQRAKPCSRDPRDTKEVAAQPFPRQAERDTRNHQAEARRPTPVQLSRWPLRRGLRLIATGGRTDRQVSSCTKSMRCPPPANHCSKRRPPTSIPGPRPRSTERIRAGSL
jgi:CHAD domain-containing protein